MEPRGVREEARCRPFETYIWGGCCSAPDQTWICEAWRVCGKAAEGRQKVKVATKERGEIDTDQY